MNFGDGEKPMITSPQIDQRNADLFRLIMTWKIWGRRPILVAKTMATKFALIRPLFVICSRHGVLASNLSRYPKILEEIAAAIPESLYENFVAEMNTLLNASEEIGFTLLDANGIRFLKASQPQYRGSQTTYIPPRIWQYQVKRLKEFIDDYRSHQNQIEECFSYCVEVYSKCGIKESRNSGKTASHLLPFSGSNPSHEKFSITADRFGIGDTLRKWVGSINGGGRGIGMFSAYLSMASYVGLAYTLNFTLARVNEGMSFRFNCLRWHEDEKFTRIPLIEGLTTKTSHDPIALWVTSPSVEAAINVMQSVAEMRSPFIPSNAGEENIHLMNYALEPWSSNAGNVDLSARQTPANYACIISRYPLIFESDQILITEEDFQIALAVTPTLNREAYQIGKPWPFTWHQLRRTGAVNMFSSGMISDSTIQLLLKHLSPIMTICYGRGHTSLNLNEEAKNLIVNEMYAAIGQDIAKLHSEQFISPHGEKQKKALLSNFGMDHPVRLISENDAIHYEKAARAHEINFRLTAVGACMKNSRCDGDGFTALSDCTGGDGRAPCANALFNRNRADANRVRLDMVVKQIKSTSPNTPRYQYLEQERRGLENYFAYIR
ncbi:hypothetical protein ICN18_05995 [Polynucleobacter sp. Ross1-W9]|uniref:hypothetical protein n=1 Tax=Polynucleobacter parvulilacunae TaxID=1855631 RepID=UPI001C0B702F|nr:hypothetical protein [Polynucleobacter parvulilacunae]MBU3557177.1 hypothetical protein [Polynucleobacter parvulilacunae]